MRRLWISIAVLMFATVGHAGKAEAGGYFTGSQLLEMCESDSVTDKTTCIVYLGGFYEATSLYDGWGILKGNHFCLPEGVTLDQLRKVAIKGLNENPENLHLAAGGPVATVLRDAWPCD